MNSNTSGLAANAPDVGADLAQSRLFNADLAPVPQSRRKWGMLNFAALWISMSACIPSTACRHSSRTYTIPLGSSALPWLSSFI